MTRRVAFGVVAGGAIGFGVAAAIYLLVNPMLEDASGWIRETQGLLWNLVPALTVLGGVLGGLLSRPRIPRRSR